MDTSEFIDETPPDVLFTALEPIRPPAGPAECATYHQNQFASAQRQQAAFDGEAFDPEVDYTAARTICLACPLLASCRKYSEDSREDHTFLGGLTAAQRSSRRLKKSEVVKRRLQVKALRGLGAPTPVIADLTGRDPSLIRGDIRSLKHAQGA